jgi:hypothetical protein
VERLRGVQASLEAILIQTEVCSLSSSVDRPYRTSESTPVLRGSTLSERAKLTKVLRNERYTMRVSAE